MGIFSQFGMSVFCLTGMPLRRPHPLPKCRPSPSRLSSRRFRDRQQHRFDLWLLGYPPWSAEHPRLNL